MLSGVSLKNKIVEIESELIEKIKEKASTVPNARYRHSATQIEKFSKFLDPREKDDEGKLTPYFQRLITYVLTLSGNLDQTHFEAVFAGLPVNAEIDTLFQSPKNVGEFWIDKAHFGFICNYKFYNFDNVLRLLLKINFLKGAALKDELSDEWKNQQLALLQQQITDFANDQGPNVVIVEDIDIEEQHRLQADDTLDRDNFFGYASINVDVIWPAYWDAFWPVSTGGLREDPSLFPLQMQNAHFYPWYERVLYFLVGADVRKYFKDQWRVLKIGFEGFKTLISQYYNDDEQGYPLTAIALLAWIMLVMLVCDFPTALVKGILGLPFRLARGLVNLICDDGSPSWKDSMDLVNKLETMLLFALFFVARIPLALLTFFGGLFVAGPILSMAVGAVTGFAKLFVKPFIECFRPNVDEPAVIVTLDAQAADAEPAPAPSSSQQLMRQLMRAKLKLGEQNDQLIIGDHVLSKREIEIDLGLLRQNKPVRNLDWLLEVKDFSVASSVRLFSLPDLHLPTRSPVGQPALVDDVVVPASIAPN